MHTLIEVPGRFPRNGLHARGAVTFAVEVKMTRILDDVPLPAAAGRALSVLAMLHVEGPVPRRSQHKVVPEREFVRARACERGSESETVRFELVPPRLLGFLVVPQLDSQVGPDVRDLPQLVFVDKGGRTSDVWQLLCGRSSIGVLLGEISVLGKVHVEEWEGRWPSWGGPVRHRLQDDVVRLEHQDVILVDPAVEHLYEHFERQRACQRRMHLQGGVFQGIFSPYSNRADSPGQLVVRA